MTLQQLLWRSNDSDLLRDLTKYRQAIEDNLFPEMINLWKETVAMIEHEIEQRNLLASASPWRIPEVLDEAPF